MSKSLVRKIIYYLNVILDITLIFSSYIIIFSLFKYKFTIVNYSAFLKVIPVILISGFAIFYTYDLFNLERKKGIEVFVSLFISLIIVNIVGMASSYFLHAFAFPRSVFAFGFLLQLFTIFVEKVIIQRILKKLNGSEKAIILSKEEEAKKLLNSLLKIDESWIDCRYAATGGNIGPISDLIKDADAILMDSRNMFNYREEITKAVFEGKKIIVIPGIYELLLSKSKITNYDDVITFEIPGWNMSNGMKIVKRFIDILSSISILIITSPLILLSAVAIKLTSEGPVLFVQERVGEKGRVFKLYKFRTMIKDAEKYTGPVIAKADDPRITKVGKILRALRIDELPQLINVLKGDMSLIGPRPERPEFVEKFSKENPFYKYRHLLKPGITGLAQVLGNYDTEFENKLRLDLYYILNYSLMLDLKIIFLTIKTILLGEGVVKKEVKDIEKKLNEIMISYEAASYKD
ncbi:MAG: sugar transferase [Thermovenabulum sp.]|uniref:sugar transferase n=1 Tax=Thermovenabulum sp. TaxID=3100335 RepID=UPI003C79D184